MLDTAALLEVPDGPGMPVVKLVATDTPVPDMEPVLLEMPRSLEDTVLRGLYELEMLVAVPENIVPLPDWLGTLEAALLDETTDLLEEATDSLAVREVFI